MGLFSRKKEPKSIEFPPYTHTLDENGVKIVLEYLRKKPNGIEFVLDGDFSMYALVLPEHRQIPDNILLSVNTKSREKLEECCKDLGRLLSDNGINVQLRNKGHYLQIETHNGKEWMAAVIMHDKTVNVSQ